jgi:hypothetical protein
MDNKQIKDGLGNLFSVRMRDVSPSLDGTLERPMHLASMLPLEYGTGGMYMHCAKSGVMANSTALNEVPIFSFLWPGTADAVALYAAVRRVRLTAWANNVFVSGIALFEIFAARAWNNFDSGGIAANLTAPNNQLRTSMSPSRAMIMIANTAPLTPGVRTLDLAPLDNQAFATPTVAAPFASSRMNLLERLQGEHPLLLNKYEGFVVTVTLPAGGPWQFTISTEWDELSIM